MKEVKQFIKGNKQTKSYTIKEIKPYSLSEQVEINKNNIAKLELNINEKVDKTYVDEQLELKANINYVNEQDQQLQSNIDTLENKVDENFTTLSTNIETGDNDVLNVLDDRFTRFIARNPEELPDEYTWTFDVYSDWKIYPQCISFIISGQPTYAITSGSIENGINNINIGDGYVINIVCPNWDEIDPTIAKSVTITNKSEKTIDNLHLNVMFEKSILI